MKYGQLEEEGTEWTFPKSKYLPATNLKQHAGTLQSQELLLII